MMLTSTVIFSLFITEINAHGYLFDPVARSSAWLVDPEFKECCTYEGHMEMYCGGVGHQWNSNGGKCGICGEPYDKAHKQFEKGGSKYLGKIVKTYTQGEQIDVQVRLSANHQGYFEFRLCSLDNSQDSDATQECLDQNLLKIVDSDSTKYRDVARHGSEMITVRLQLPLNMACQHCVFQWKYTTGNNWGRDPLTNKSGPGLGRENETFMGCSDVTILPKKTTTTRRPKTKTSRTTTSVRKSTRQWSILSPKHWSLLLTVLLSAATTTPPPTATMTTLATPPLLPIATTIIAVTPRSTKSVALWSGLLVAYKKGDEVLYNGGKYRCVTSHHSYAGSEPSPLTWALWRKIS